MELAPMPKVSMALVMSAASSLNTKRRSINHTLISSRPRPTTVKPMTEPAEKATRRPRFRPSRQALAVRQLALVAMRIPTKPDRPEKKPPVRKAIGTHSFCTPNPYAMMENKTTRARNTEATTLYCCFRYDIAPLRTCRAIFVINSVPSLSFIICLKKNQANASARTDANGIIQKILVIITW